jgi:hypothetical protein
MINTSSTPSKFRNSAVISVRMPKETIMLSVNLSGDNKTSSRLTRRSQQKMRHRQLNSCTPGFTFSKIARFDSNIFDKFKRSFYLDLSPLFQSNISKSRDALKEKLKSNKNMKPFSPVEKLIRLRKSSMNYKTHRESIKEKKVSIFNQQKEEKAKKLLEKFRRFEIRYNKSVSYTKDSISAKRAWLVLLSGISFSFISQQTISLKKMMKVTIANRIRWLCVMCKCLARFKGLLVKVRRIKSLQVFII